MIPPAPKKTRLVAMYRIPIRLWSVVVSQEVTRPRLQSTAAGGASTLMAKRRSPLRLLQVADDPRDLRLVPVAADGRQRAERGGTALAQERRDVRGFEGAVLQGRSVGARAVHPVALGADARERLLGDRLAPRRVRGEERVVLLPRHDVDRAAHLRVEDPAELAAATGVVADGVRFEPGVVDPARDRVELRAQRRYPPAVDDVDPDD